MVKANLRQHRGFHYFVFQYGMNPDYPRAPLFLKTLPCQWNPLVRSICPYSRLIRNSSWSKMKISEICHGNLSFLYILNPKHSKGSSTNGWMIFKSEKWNYILREAVIDSKWWQEYSSRELRLFPYLFSFLSANNLPLSNGRFTGMTYNLWYAESANCKYNKIPYIFLKR